MSIEVECRSCGKIYDVDDHRAGQRISCRDCGDPITVREGRGRRGYDRDDDYDVRNDRPRRDRDDYETPPDDSKSPVGLILGLVGGGLLLLILVCGGAVLYVTWSIKRGVDNAVNTVDQFAKQARDRLILNEGQALAALGSPEAAQRLQAVRFLEMQQVPQNEGRRQMVRKAVEKLIDDQDFAVRAAAQRLHERLRNP